MRNNTERFSRLNLQEVVYPEDGGEPYNSFISPMLNRFVRNLYDKKTIIVDSATESDLQLISFREYGTVSLWWVIGMYNGVVNPFTDLEIGTPIRLPTNPSIEDYFISNVKLQETTVKLP